ncbi:RagB/SusD family nutrient uptake outer membrane protein [Maribellus maritimus]|uniref:RagB/SusD family nutrient uptake outer membrane protein n=1 Tax=Maribellus maritimus TaxID=2870838 RepID=UPI001EECB0DF|nr:RagB/SusD family nutrient uptake outer membrane protein [Maribellus maritimus]MCG6188599.1 RagB/SusD family nutrient uptake outer membrane protein [Maribellus maritimus]
MKKRKFSILKYLVVFILFAQAGCDYLDVVPDNIATVDNAFTKRYQAEGYLYGCYGFLPNIASPGTNPGFYGSDETWLFDGVDESTVNPQMWEIARGNQGTESPIGNYWASQQDSYELNGGKTLWTAIRDCNIFLENIDTPQDMEEWERKQWIAEAKFLKAYFHFWLLRMYGPIPIVDENMEISTGTEGVMVYRDPVDDVVDYIVNLLDSAMVDLPLTIDNITDDLGRATQPMAAAVKAQALTLAASPLFNGNSDYTGITDSRGVQLFSTDYDAVKWEKAATALQEAIDIAHQAGNKLFDFSTLSVASQLSEATTLSMGVRGAVTEEWNDEIIWGCTSSSTPIQRVSYPAFNANHKTGSLLLCNAPTLNVVKQFYTKNGVPIDEDKEWEGIDLYEIMEGDSAHSYYIEEGYETCRLHFNREPRFYGSISFDGSTIYGNGALSDESMKVIQLRYGQAGSHIPAKHSSTGYLVKKVCSRLTALDDDNTAPSYNRYAFPVIRLADLYLMYAEALNEVKAAPDDEVYEYIDLVRARSGLEGVVASWANYSNNASKPLSRDGMREIIRQERMIELAFEGIRFWDLRRWKLAEEYMNTPIQGFDVLEEDAEGFYQVQTLFNEQSFEMKDYLWPLRQGNLLKNQNLVQNPGW